MLQIVDAFWKVCLMRLGPQDLPSSRFLLWSSAFAYMLVSWMVSLLTLSPLTALLSALVDTGVLMGLAMLVLWVRELGVRYTQTATALLGAGALLMALALPFLILQREMGEDNNFLPSIIVLALMIWNLNVVGHILRHALDTRFFVGLLLSIVYLYVSISVFRAFFGAAVGS